MNTFVLIALAFLLVLPTLVYAEASITDFELKEGQYFFVVDAFVNHFYIDGNEVAMVGTPMVNESSPHYQYRILYMSGNLLEAKDGDGNLIASYDISSYKEKPVVSPQWSCTYNKEPYGDIKITYVNENAVNKAKIFAINPQKAPVIYPGSELLLQINSGNCLEFTLVVKDSSGNEVGKYSEKPYSPYAECVIPQEISTERETFLTNFIFNTSLKPGTTTLSIFDDQDVLLTAAEIQVLDLQSNAPSTSRTSWCTVNNSDYAITMDAPYPVIVGKNNPGTMSVIIKGQDVSIIKDMFNQISASIQPRNEGQIPLEKSGNLKCSADECRQDYSIEYSGSAFVIANVWQEVKEPTNSKSSINSEAISILDIGKLKEIKSETEKLSNAASQYIKNNPVVGDDKAAKGAKKQLKSWENVRDKLSLVSDKLNTIIPALESKNYKLSDVIELTNIAKNFQNDADEMINELSGIESATDIYSEDNAPTFIESATEAEIRIEETPK